MKHMSAVKKQEVESDLISTKPNFLFSFLKKGRLDKAADAFNTYVVLKVHNLKSTTIDRRGSEPSWEQDFMFEISADEKGFTIELWKKGLLWDSILGILWIPLAAVEHATDEGPGAWWTLHSEIIKNGSEIQGTRTPTSHEILLDVYFVLPFEEIKIKLEEILQKQDGPGLFRRQLHDTCPLQRSWSAAVSVISSQIQQT
ncbi:protein unc-13 homolog A isoform X10 [Anas platyrhynchos]|uniref:protein unc-13 homolog A isoform X10 n=2 Tax=Anas platyrhynchos TaxID=8839 RepID=UPI003AF2EDF6